VKPDDILIALPDLTERERIEFLPRAPDVTTVDGGTLAVFEVIVLPVGFEATG